MLKRYKPLNRGKPLVRNTSGVSSRRNKKVSSEKTRKRIEHFSEKTSAKNKIYAIYRKIFLSLFKVCGVGLPGCTRVACEVHHRRGRGRLLLIIKYYLGVCRSCHDKIGVESKDAISNGWSVSRHMVENTHLQPPDTNTISVILKSGVPLNVIYW